MVAKKNSLKTISEITDKQKKFIDILVENWGSITKVDALLKAGYQSRSRSSASVLAHKLLNPEQTPQLVRYFEHKMQQETDKYEKDKFDVDNKFFGKWGLSVVYDRWGIDVDNGRESFELVKHNYKDTLMYEFYNHDPINGPLKSFPEIIYEEDR